MRSIEKCAGGTMRQDCPRAVKLATAIWIGCAVAGVAGLTNCSSAPGIAAGHPPSNSTVSALPRPSARPALVMFVHPRCPCSSASINELARVVASTRDRMDLTVLFVVPPDCPPDWHHTALWASANSIPGLRVIADHEGKLASQFGVMTSGHCLVYDAQDKLAFSGGITAGRGHEGDSPGQAIIAEIASRKMDNKFRECSTYGCPLHSRRVQNH